MIDSIMKMVGLSGSLGNEASKASNENKSPVLGLAAAVLGTAFPAAGMVMGILDSVFAGEKDINDPVVQGEIKSYLDEYKERMAELAQEAAKIDKFVEHMSAEEVDDAGKDQGFW